MYGASTAPPALDGRCARLYRVLFAGLPVAESMRTILMPLQNDPYVSHHAPDWSTTRFGSIALWSLELLVCTTTPWLVQLPGCAVVLVARKIAELREPNVEAE
jgi:hypothetical protein